MWLFIKNIPSKFTITEISLTAHFFIKNFIDNCWYNYNCLFNYGRIREDTKKHKSKSIERTINPNKKPDQVAQFLPFKISVLYCSFLEFITFPVS